MGPMNEPITNADDLTYDEQQVLKAYRYAVKCGHADVEISVKNGRVVKLWTTEKWDTEKGKLREPNP